MDKLETAVLLITYKRIDTTKSVFEAIKLAKPPRLYIASNIGFDDRSNQDVFKVRSFLESSVDWNCEVYKLYRSRHLSAKDSISSAIDWFFDNEKMGIILEDDCLPSQSFFLFCENLLNKYKDDLRIWHIGGTSTLNDEILLNNESYYFSNFNHIWGWASWANRWKMYDRDLLLFNEFVNLRYIENITKNKLLQNFWISNFNNVHNKKIDTWDYQWYYTTWINRGLSIIPTANLVSNLGFSADATHTSDAGHRLSNMERKEIDLKLVHPKIMMPNTIYDNYNSHFLFGINYLNYARNEFKKIIKRLIKLFKND
jgi:hypothetical protein